MDVVTQVLLDRSRVADKISRAVVVSLIAHGLLLSVIAFLPSHFGLRTRTDASTPMMITLGGAPGPRQGNNPISAKPVQEATTEPVKPNMQPPPALTKPEMVEPLKNAKPQPKPAVKDTSKPLQQLHGRTPTKGAEVKAGTARAETGGAQVPFGGYATGGGAGAGAAYTYYANFCCPDYLQTMVQMVQRNWQQNQGVDGTVKVKFTIQRSGLITDVDVEQQSAQFLNLAAQRAVVQTRQLPPLPTQFPGDHLTVHLVFQFKR
jgi:TonB family protein